MTGCKNAGSGGNFPSGWNPSSPGQPGTYTWDGPSGQYADFYCEKREHTQSCDC